MAEYQAKFLPVFFVIDTSGSMGFPQPDGPPLIDVVNRLVPQIVDACRAYPTLDQYLRFGLIEFNDSASEVIPLGEADSFANRIPVLRADGLTDFANALTLLYDHIGESVHSLQAPGIGVYRPVVFFITDGADMGNRVARDRAWANLTDPNFKYRPNFFTFGLGSEVQVEELRSMKSGKGFAAVNQDPAKAARGLTELMHSLVQSIVSSSTGASPDGSSTGEPGNLNFTIDQLGDDWEELLD